MFLAVDLNKIRDNIRKEVQDKLFNWIDIRYNIYGLGLNAIEEMLKFDNIGFFTNNLQDALKIRNVDKKKPIIINKLIDIDQIYDIIINDFILTINSYEQLEEIKKLNIQDDLQLFIQIDLNNFEDGLSLRNFDKAINLIKENKHFNLKGVFGIINNLKNSNITNLKEIIENYKLSSFLIGKKCSLTSDGFLTKDIYANVSNSLAIVEKCYKLEKNDFFIKTKIRRKCFGIKLNILGANLGKEKKYLIDNKFYKSIYQTDEYLYLVGKEALKVGKKLDFTKYFFINNDNNWKKIYILNGKNVEYNNFK